MTAPAIVGDVLRSSGAPLDARTRAYFEPRFGHDFGSVRVHDGALADASARAVNAVAYTVGSDVVFRRGALAPETASGKRLLAHELAHVVQGAMFTTQPAPSSALTIARADDRSERDADRTADAILRTDAPATPSIGALETAGGRVLRRTPKRSNDPIHQPIIDDFRRRHGLPPGGVDPMGHPVGPSDAEIKYRGKEALMSPCPLPGAGTEGYRDLTCLRAGSENQAPDCYFTDEHHALIRPAQALAISWVQRSLGFMHFGAAGRRLALDQARITFGSAAPALAELERQAQVTLAVLQDRSLELLGATCGDSTCNSPPFPIAYRVAGQRQLRFCPRTFLDVNVESLARTILHECLHIAGQPADSNDPLNYCDSEDCAVLCRERLTADTWKQFFACLGHDIQIRRDFNREIEDSVRDAG